MNKVIKTCIFAIIICSQFEILAQPVKTKSARKSTVVKKTITSSKAVVATVSSNLQKRDTTNFGKLKIRSFDQKSQAFFPQGDEALFTHIAHELKYTQTDIDKKIDGKVLLRFDVDVDSSVIEVRVIRDPCVDCGKALVGIFEKLKFTPAVTSKGTFMRSNLMLEIPVWAH